MSFFPLNYICTIQAEGEAVNDPSGSGQKISAGWVPQSNPRCLYLTTSGGSKTTAGQEAYEAIVVLYLDPGVPIEEGNRVVDIRTRTGEVIEAGPFEVHSVKRTPGLAGTVHHLTVKLRGVG